MNFFRGFDGNQAADETADDGLAGHEEDEVVGVLKCERGIFEPVEQLAADRGAGDRRRDDRPPRPVTNHIATPPLPQIESETDDVCKRLEQPVKLLLDSHDQS